LKKGPEGSLEEENEADEEKVELTREELLEGAQEKRKGAQRKAWIRNLFLVLMRLF
jgi:hypothetical protein